MANILWRNDDISVDSDVKQLRAVQAVFEKHGQREVYSVVPFGKPIYENYDHSMPLQTLEELLDGPGLATNKEVVQFLRESIARGHGISLHGWKHTRVTDYPEEQIKWEIEKAGAYLETGFSTPIQYFVPPFNHYNDTVLKVCAQLDLPVSRGGGQLEKLIAEGKHEDHDMYWYHYWRINDLEKLDEWLTHTLITRK